MEGGFNFFSGQTTKKNNNNSKDVCVQWRSTPISCGQLRMCVPQEPFEELNQQAKLRLARFIIALTQTLLRLLENIRCVQVPLG